MSAPGRRVVRLPDEGVLIVATDLHGNYKDYERLWALYAAEERAGNRPFLLFCGDLVHGPNPEMNLPGAWPEHLGTSYTDESVAIVLDYMERSRQSRTCCLLGNHEHAHIGGPVLGKFHDDEAAELERALGPRYAEQARRFFRSFPIIAVSPCGAVFTHGAPYATEPDIEAFERLRYDGYETVSIWAMPLLDTLGALLWARSASSAQARAFLSALAADDELAFVAYGHDIVDDGYEKVGREQICVSTSYGLLDERKVYLRLDLSSHYASVEQLVEGREICSLYA